MTTPGSKATNGLLIDYEFCTNCHTCEVACKKVHDLPIGQYGIKTLEYGPVKNINGKWEWTYLPLPTDLCDLCADRVAEGKSPICVEACPLRALEFGDIEELRAKHEGTVAGIAPMPSPDETTPSIAILPCPAAKEPGDTTGAIANEKEVTGVA